MQISRNLLPPFLLESIPFTFSVPFLSSCSGVASFSASAIILAEERGVGAVESLIVAVDIVAACVCKELQW